MEIIIYIIGCIISFFLQLLLYIRGLKRDKHFDKDTNSFLIVLFTILSWVGAFLALMTIIVLYSLFYFERKLKL